jgi:hypothetical protein
MQLHHTGENMFQLIVTFFDTLLSNWKGKLIGISSDGASNMTGAFQVKLHVYRNWLSLGCIVYGVVHIKWIWLSKRQLLFYATRVFCPV